MSASHQQPNLFKSCNFRIYLTRYSSFMNDQQPIGKTGHFFELCRDKEDRAPSITQRDQLTVDKLDRADINSARWL
jgi:hypothetical protein